MSFISVKKDGQPLEYCVWADPAKGEALIAATECSGPNKDKPIVDTDSPHGYQTIPIRGKIEVITPAPSYPTHQYSDPYMDPCYDPNCD
jgi:hypothetical protein